MQAGKTGLQASGLFMSAYCRDSLYSLVNVVTAEDGLMALAAKNDLFGVFVGDRMTLESLWLHGDDDHINDDDDDDCISRKVYILAETK